MSRRRFAYIGWGVAASLAAGLTLAHVSGLRLNFTHSAPSGLWHVRAIAPAALERGKLVEVCPPPAPIVVAMRERGYLSQGWLGRCEPAGVAALLKPVAAVAGDRVTVHHGEPVKVNGVALANTKAEKGIPAWPDGEYVVQPGQVWLFSSYSAGSFDSRYFGPVPVTNVRGEASPILIRGDTATMTIGVTTP